MGKQNIFELLKTNFEFDRFLENSEGFEFFPKDSKKITSNSNSNLDGYEYKAFKNVQGSSTISLLLVSRNSNGHYVYNNPNDSSDKGSAIDYFIRHKGMDWKDIAAFAKDSNIQLPETPSAPEKIKPIVDESKPVEIVKVEDYRSNLYFKNDRQIESTILSNPYIQDAVKFVRFKRQDQEGKTQALFGHAFPIKSHTGQVTTFNMKSDFFKRGMFLGERKSGLWYALPEPMPKSYLIGESAIDVISYYQKQNTKKSIGLISTEGRFSARYADELLLLDPNIKQAEITLVNDNDIHGFHYDLAWMQKLHDLPFSAGTKKKSPTENFIRIESSDKQLAQELIPFQDGDDLLLKPESIVPAIKHIKQKYDLGHILIHKSPLNDWNNSIRCKKKAENSLKPSI